VNMLAEEWNDQTEAGVAGRFTAKKHSPRARPSAGAAARRPHQQTEEASRATNEGSVRARLCAEVCAKPARRRICCEPEKTQ
jgi:hypothetical protein